MKKLILASAISIILAGCGGSDSSSDPSVGGGNITNPSNPAPDTQTPTQVSGPVDNVYGDTVSVNGENYNLDSVSYRGQQFAPDILEDGASVELSYVDGKWSAELNPDFVAQVVSKTGFGASSTITLNTGHTFTSASVADIDVWDWVLVFLKKDASGLPTGEVLAVVDIDDDVSDNRPETGEDNDMPDTVDNIDLQGRIYTIDQPNKTFTLDSGIQVDYSKVRNTSAIQPGRWVDIEGYYKGSMFVALTVELDDKDLGDVSGVSEEDGIITSVRNISSGNPSFTLSFRTDYNTDSNTCYRLDDSFSCDRSLINTHLRYNAEVTVKSTFKNGVHLATEVEFDHNINVGGGNTGGGSTGGGNTGGGNTGGGNTGGGNAGNTWSEFSCTGLASGYSAATQSFKVQYCEEEVQAGYDDYDRPLSDNTVYVDANTRWYGVSAANINGAYVEVDGFRSGGRNVARDIEREDNDWDGWDD